MMNRLLPLIACCLAACASGSQPAPSVIAEPVARIQMCPDFGLREFDCPTAERRRPECVTNRTNYKFLGDVMAAKTGASTDDREVYAEFAERARRLKPDAIIEVRREQRPGSNVWQLHGRAVTFLDPTCKSP
jgi:hypothetical protein